MNATDAPSLPQPFAPPVTPAADPHAERKLPAWPRGPGGIGEVLRVAFPLMVSSGCLSLVLFADRTLLLRYDGDSMSAAMAAGNLFWALICLPLGIASMSGAFVAQYIGANRADQVGRFLWQTVFLSFATIPAWMLAAYFAPQLFRWTGQSPALLELETVYLRVLMIGSVAGVLEASLSGFFSGTHRTMTVMWINVAAAILNLLLDVPLIFGWGPIPAMGIAGAAAASVVSFWFKAVAYAYLLLRPRFREQYQLFAGFTVDWAMGRRLLFFGFPAGLQHLAEAGAFTVIVLQIGQLGSMPLQATTMAINFNMIAFVPLIGVSIAASVVVGQHLTRSGARIAVRAAHTTLLIAMVYSASWAILYVSAPHFVMSFYEHTAVAGGEPTSQAAAASAQQLTLATDTAVGLLGFVAAYILFDGIQLVLAGVLRGAGDTWYVLVATGTASSVALAVGLLFEPASGGLLYWWYVITAWIWMLALLMIIRYLQGHWKHKRLVQETPLLET
ncbi:MATE family efflux transporter [Planctomycetaceae bacterium SH139]